MKRFTVRKLKQHAYSRQGWILKDCGFVYAIYDREWQKNFDACGCSWCCDGKYKDMYKYVADTAHFKEVAQFWADWLNANKAETFGVRISIPGSVFQQGLALYKQHA